MAVMGVNYISRQLFNALRGMGSRSHDMNIGVNHAVSRTKTRDKIDIIIMYNVKLIYGSHKDTLESLET